MKAAYTTHSALLLHCMTYNGFQRSANLPQSDSWPRSGPATHAHTWYSTKRAWQPTPAPASGTIYNFYSLPDTTPSSPTTPARKKAPWQFSAETSSSPLKAPLTLSTSLVPHSQWCMSPSPKRESSSALGHTTPRFYNSKRGPSIGSSTNNSRKETDVPDKKDIETAYREFKIQHPHRVPTAIPYKSIGWKHESVSQATGKVPPLTLLLASNEANPDRPPSCTTGQKAHTKTPHEIPRTTSSPPGLPTDAPL